MQHHGLGHLPQPDNFTTVGKLGIEVKQYNNPIDCYSGNTKGDRSKFLRHLRLCDLVASLVLIL